jgi:hypothetical protein
MYMISSPACSQIRTYLSASLNLQNKIKTLWNINNKYLDKITAAMYDLLLSPNTNVAIKIIIVVFTVLLGVYIFLFGIIFLNSFLALSNNHSLILCKEDTEPQGMIKKFIYDKAFKTTFREKDAHYYIDSKHSHAIIRKKHMIDHSLMLFTTTLKVGYSIFSMIINLF